MHATQSPSLTQPKKTFLIDRYRVNHDWLNCCPTATTLPATEKSTGLPTVIAVPCRRWGCAYCGPKKAFHLACRTELAKPTKFITVTSDAKLWEDGRTCYDATRRKVAEFAKRIRKEVGSFEYLRVLERHANGLPHYHFVARCRYIPQKWLSTQWAELTGSIIVHVKAIEERTNVFRYMMKYLCKQEYIPWTSRRVSWSKDFFPKPDTIELRPNPYDVGERRNCHPTAYMQHKYFGHRYTEQRPGVWVLEKEPYLISADNLIPPQKRELPCLQKNLPLTDSMRRDHS